MISAQSIPYNVTRIFQILAAIPFGKILCRIRKMNPTRQCFVLQNNLGTTDMAGFFGIGIAVLCKCPLVQTFHCI